METPLPSLEYIRELVSRYDGINLPRPSTTDGTEFIDTITRTTDSTTELDRGFYYTPYIPLTTINPIAYDWFQPPVSGEFPPMTWTIDYSGYANFKPVIDHFEGHEELFKI